MFVLTCHSVNTSVSSQIQLFQPHEQRGGGKEEEKERKKLNINLLLFHAFNPLPYCKINTKSVQKSADL